MTRVEFQQKGTAHPFSASIDRIDNSKGYLQENCRFILFGLNMLKGVGTDEEMRQIALHLTLAS